jgi:ParB/RepB/Spo0J family partition protein
MRAKPRHQVFSPSDGRPSSIPINEILVGPRLRTLDQGKVADLAQSIAAIGLQTPITVRRTAKGYELVVGWHRLEGARLAGHLEILAFVKIMDDRVAIQCEIAENLHRAELTALERDEHVAKWIELTEGNVSAQHAPKCGRPESGINAAARELGIERTDAQRAVRVASFTEEAKKAARETGLDDNRHALLDAAREAPNQQAERVRELARRKRRSPEEVAADKAHKAQRRVAKEAREAKEEATKTAQDAAYRDSAMLIVKHVPAESLRSLLRSLEDLGLSGRTDKLASCIFELRPELAANSDGPTEATTTVRPDAIGDRL